MPDALTQSSLPDVLLDRVSEVLAAQTGLHYPRERWPDLERGLAEAARRFDLTSTEACALSLVSAPLDQRQIEILASSLTIGETYFFRDQRSFDLLEQQIIPNLLRAREHGDRHIRIWSAGCSTGEEPYSIAISLARMIPNLEDWNISILATDVDPGFIAKAALGIFGEWSFRDAPPGIRLAYFTKTANGQFRIAPRIRSLVSFAYLNLAEDSYPSAGNGTEAMDLIFCRNVLIYFEPACAQDVLRRLGRSLNEGGWLLVNPIEAPHVALPELVPAGLPGAFVHRKTSRRKRGTPSLSPAPKDVLRPVSTPGLLVGSAARKSSSERRRRTADSRTAQVKRAESAAQTLYAQAARAYAEGRYPDAIARLTQLAVEKPDDSRALALLVRAYADQGQLEEARRWCEKALDADKLNPAWCYLLSTILQEQGCTEEAADALRRAVYLDPGHALAHFALGNLLRRQGNPVEADRHFRSALAVVSTCAQEQILPDSGGITAGELAQIIQSAVLSEEAS